jgi:hypothetical protein
MKKKDIPGFAKRFSYVAAVILVVSILSAFKQEIGISTGTWILLGCLLLYFQFALTRLQERIGLEQVPSLDSLLARNDDEPIVPRHKTPPQLPPSGWGINEEVQLFFEDFRQFANIANEELKETLWRLEETERTDVATVGDDYPVIGRQYKLFYGSRWSGKISLSNGYRYSRETPEVFTTIEVFQSRIFGSHELHDLAAWLISLNCSAFLEEQSKAYEAVRQAMIDVMWQIGPEVVTNSDLDVRFNGHAERYLIKAGIMLPYNQRSKSC